MLEHAAREREATVEAFAQERIGIVLGRQLQRVTNALLGSLSLEEAYYEALNERTKPPTWMRRKKNVGLDG